MRVVTFAELLAMPAGTIFCSLDGGYAENLYRKEESALDGFWKAELLPQRTGVTRHDAAPAWQPKTFWPTEYVEDDAVFYVLDPDDVRHLAARLTAP